MKQFNRKKGSVGEKIAADFLFKKGYKILEKNYSTKFGEIDLIVTHSTSSGRVLVFVEVKSKETEDFGTPEEMIGRKKLMQVQRTAELYLMKNPDIEKKYDSLRIDAVCIVGPPSQSLGEVKRIDHYENLTF